MALHEGHRQRLKQTYADKGAAALQEHQLLELLLCYAIPRKDVNPIAHALIKRFGSLQAVLRADVEELKKADGVGENAAVLINLAGALRDMAEKPKGKLKLDTPLAAASYCTKLLRGEKYEKTLVIALDGTLGIIHYDIISRGTVSENTLYPRHVVECALRHGAAHVIISHNHPSGDPRPSAEDVAATKAVHGALSAIGIALHDHIIVGGEQAYSMARSGIITAEGEREKHKIELESF